MLFLRLYPPFFCDKSARDTLFNIFLIYDSHLRVYVFFIISYVVLFHLWVVFFERADFHKS
eukprot:UN03247